MINPFDSAIVRKIEQSVLTKKSSRVRHDVKSCRLPSHTTVRTSRIRRFASLVCASSYIWSISGNPRDSRYLLDRMDWSGLNADMCHVPWDLACIRHPATCHWFGLMAINLLNRFPDVFHWCQILARSFLRAHLAKLWNCHLDPARA